ncbi:stress protein [Paenibacillus curdlanolyticus YK9]|uniref:Stress protein n=1 Tax=Paenibacillus curdlanolyticus YK9 TaxID=717606 RepID=E0IAK4_9BACL|nr:TerD family protein [Paenibacillus curdlanolyticus]EFM10408.1 stress protein [Paenibacillus curdlanolyticus YK9]
MAVAVVKGQKVDITKTNPGLTQLKVAIGWQSSSAVEVDTSAFLLGENGMTSGDEDLIFYNQPSNGFIRYENGQAPDQKQFVIDLQRVPANIHRVAFSLTLYDEQQGFKQVKDAYIRFMNGATGQEAVRYDLGNNFSVETAVVVGEFYRYNGEWKFNAIGSGFSGGLKALCANYGIAVQQDEPAKPPVPSSAPTPSPAPAASVPPPSSPSSAGAPVHLNLKKIELKKKGDKINLTKGPKGDLGEIRINLNWNRQQGKGGFFSKSRSVDLDLACLYELNDGRKGVVQALGNSFGSLDRAPYVALDGDDRTGTVATGENIRINGARVSEIKRILIFTFIYQGAANWKDADGVVTIEQQGGPDIIVHMNEHDNQKGMCAIAMIHNVGNETFSIERLVQFYNGHSELDRAYDWGMRWVAGKK